MLLALFIRLAPWYSPAAKSAAYSGVKMPSRAALLPSPSHLCQFFDLFRQSFPLKIISLL